MPVDHVAHRLTVEPTQADPIRSRWLTRAVAALPPRHRRVMRETLAGKTQAQIGREMGCCYTNVYRIAVEAVDALRMSPRNIAG